ncbi:HAD-IC family P-type ATPase [Nocardioides sp. zg-DK7169]|uniref:cation-translocating P-type ATPase n=1 Tax=Nocardioides sp. zg-DK7169 TaxID=2736600 RepID=UPI001552E9D8|nr:HAD-IC family P-type ATPase [Nocardioides sp. zg-DK7169]NPC96573.1 HAD-IC family P-type ATPase [Nocardioides sp. zg-DK7169]
MDADTADVRGRTPHDLAVPEVLALLHTDADAGLDGQEAARRLAADGPNQLPRPRTAGPVRRFLRQLNSPLVYVLIAAGIVTFVLREYVDASVIAGVVVVNAILGFIQESKAESALDALRSMVTTEARVIRDGSIRTVPSEDLVTGDLVLVEAGDKVPADLRLVRSTELRADESALTGESLPVDKADMVLAPETPVSDRRNMLYSGTLVTNGTGAGIVVATGAGTQLGEIHRLVGSADTMATPLTRKLASFSTWLTVVILALALVTFVVGVLRGEPAADMFVAVVALAVGAIPEGLPAAVAITLAIGVSRMARQHAVIRRLPAVETLGGATVICSDKTGTLTQNRMTVRTLWTFTQEVPVEGADAVSPGGPQPEVLLDEALRWTLVIGANCNESRLDDDGGDIGDPTETAMLRVARRYGVGTHTLPRVGEVPFTSERQYMATLHTDPGSGGQVLLVKGAVERVSARCTGQLGADGSSLPLDADAVHEAAERLAADGMRVLATAVARDPAPDALDELAAGRGHGLVLAGLQAMMDPPRDTARRAVATCRNAGLQVKMITGDHATTAASIARQIGILGNGAPEGVLAGAELERVTDEELPDAVERTSVFARVSPDQKLRLVGALQSRHHVVAMTGDGVNDAPALKQADIGIAMGRGGTEAAKDAADMVLLDDDFATIEAAVEEGRGVYDNLTKFIVWTLPTNLGEGLVILVAILLGAALPILPTQILWINMTTAVALGLMLAWEPKEAGIMDRQPRDPRQPLLTRTMVLRTVLVSVLLVVGSWWVFQYERGAGASLDVSRTAAVNLFVTVEAFYLFICRSLTGPSWRVGLFTNRWLLVGVTVQAIGQAALTYVPAMNTLFQTAPLDWETWLRILGVAVVISLVVSLDKARAIRSEARSSARTAVGAGAG